MNIKGRFGCLQVSSLEESLQELSCKSAGSSKKMLLPVGHETLVSLKSLQLWLQGFGYEQLYLTNEAEERLIQNASKFYNSIESLASD